MKGVTLSLRDRIRSKFNLGSKADDESTARFSIHYDSSSANFVLDHETFGQLTQGVGSSDLREQYIVLSVLEEAGSARLLPNGFEVAAENVARLGKEESEILGLPPRFDGRFQTDIQGHSRSQRFQVRISTVLDTHPEPWERIGPLLKIGTGREFRLRLSELRAIEAIEAHSALSIDERTETRNVELVARLQNAVRLSRQSDEENNEDRPLELSLAQLDKFETVEPHRVGVIVEPQKDGSLLLTPDLGTHDDPDTLNKRWSQLDLNENAGVLRIEDKLVLLDRGRMQGIKSIRSNRRIPASEAPNFYKAPGDFLDVDTVDVELSFSVRVEGIGTLVPISFREASETGIQWIDDIETALQPELIKTIAKTLDELDGIEEKVVDAWSQDQEYVSVDEHLLKIDDHPRVRNALDNARHDLQSRLDAKPQVVDPEDVVQVGVIVKDSEVVDIDVRNLAHRAAPTEELDDSTLNRRPFPHQRDGISWLTGMMEASLEDGSTPNLRIQGGILADDMGLGKTFMTVVALREFVEAQVRRGTPPLPNLVVVPLTLIENWEDEIEKAFPNNPFTEVLVLHGNRDLPKYQRTGMGRETAAEASSLDERGMVKSEDIRLSLRVGEQFGDRRLDMPGRLILTTYDTLRSFQLSLGQVNWGCVVFDEAQHTKNPEALVSRAAKGLKARFKLMATGTPVENSLKDLWCLMDTAQPGLLGTWTQFRQDWVNDVQSGDPEFRAEMGRRLRDHLGPFMLRRIKEDHLPDLPSKTIYSGIETGEETHQYEPFLAVEMPQIQQRVYEEQLSGYKPRALKGPGAALETIQRLRNVSLHPLAISKEILDSKATPEMSARLIATLQVLDEIKNKGEKVIIFVINKSVQTKLALWLSERYTIPIDVINGDTKAVSRGNSETRRSKIRQFEAKPGFNVIIMSPLAAGTGLTVVGANHAIHLERHWNPAKESQATDRIYRIGQTRPVHVYMPLATHPSLTSFDVNLDQLLRQKSSLRDAVVVPEVVTEAELAEAMGLTD